MKLGSVVYEFGSDVNMADVLVLGCGNKPVAGAVNHDRTRHSDFVDIDFDLTCTPWPVDRKYSHIIAIDVLEHLPDFIQFFDQCHRILEDGGQCLVQTVHYQSENAWRDPTHVRPYHPDAFAYLDPDTFWGKEYSMYTEKKWKILATHVDGNIICILQKRN